MAYHNAITAYNLNKRLAFPRMCRMGSLSPALETQHRPVNYLLDRYLFLQFAATGGEEKKRLRWADFPFQSRVMILCLLTFITLHEEGKKTIPGESTRHKSLEMSMKQNDKFPQCQSLPRELKVFSKCMKYCAIDWCWYVRKRGDAETQQHIWKAQSYSPPKWYICVLHSCHSPLTAGKGCEMWDVTIQASPSLPPHQPKPAKRKSRKSPKKMPNNIMQSINKQWNTSSERRRELSEKNEVWNKHIHTHSHPIPSHSFMDTFLRISFSCFARRIIDDKQRAFFLSPLLAQLATLHILTPHHSRRVFS